MIHNYLKIAIRNILKSKLFSIINISGMAVSLASCFLIALFVWDELQFDRFHPDGDRTYRVFNKVTHGDIDSYLPIVPYPFATYMQKDFPEIESTLRIMDTCGELLIEGGGQKLMEKGGIYAEPNVFDMLTISLSSGNMATALNKPSAVVISATLAQKYFAGKNPIGESLKIDGDNFEVTGVFTDPPKNFHLSITYIMSFAATRWAVTHENNWQQQQIFTYLKLTPATDAAALEAKFKPFVEKYAYPIIESKGFTYMPHLQNIQDIHLKSSNFEWEMAIRGNAQSVYILTGTAIMILIIACLNFVNLSTARSIKRMKEVGVRKVIGAYRRQLVLQFISESIVFTLFGLVLSIILVELALPVLNDISGKQLQLPYSPFYGLSAIAFCVVLGAMAGSYPAIHLSRFRPAAVLSRKGESQSGTAVLRQSLVVLQFMFSFFLITSSWIVFSQNDLLQNKNLGFDKEQVVVVPLRGVQFQHQEATKAKYADHPGVIAATIGFGLPGDIVAGDQVIDPVNDKILPASLFCVDFDYLSTMGMEVIAGRGFSTEFPSDSSEAFILNEAAVGQYGLGTPEQAIGKKLRWKQWHNQKDKNGRVIGVVKDFHFKSLREKLSPVVLQIYPQAAWKLSVRIKPDDMSGTIAHLKKTYESYSPDWIFTYSFLDENFDAMYKSEERLGKLFPLFTYLAIAVACLGLFGLVEYSVNQRTKEISIRKVFGASTRSLLLLLTKKYFVLVMIAFLLVIPVSYYAAGEWLSSFAYHITISPWMYVKACLLIVLITAVTVSFQSLKAAWTNPARALQNE